MRDALAWPPPLHPMLPVQLHARKGDDDECRIAVLTLRDPLSWRRTSTRPHGGGALRHCRRHLHQPAPSRSPSRQSLRPDPPSSFMSFLSPSSGTAGGPATHELASLFRLVDRDQSGSISRHELSQLLHSLNLHPTSQSALDSLIQACDSNDDGEIDWHEFTHLMQLHSRSSTASRRDSERGGRSELLEALAAFSAPPAAAPTLRGQQRARSGTRGGGVGVAESSRRASALAFAPSASALSLPMLEKAMDVFHMPTGNRALDEKRAAWREMLQQLQVDGAGGFHHQQLL